MTLIGNFSLTIKVRRLGPGKYSNGYWQEGSSTQFEIRASVQPASPREIELLSEGRRIIEAVKIYSDTELLVTSKTNSKNADIVIYNGVEFEVVKVDKWALAYDLPHYKAIAVRVEVVK